MSVTHGATALRIVDPIADELMTGLLERRGDLVKFPEALHAWARAEARCLLLGNWVAEHGIVDSEGVPTASAKIIAQFERLANDLRQRLGLDPRSEAELASVQADAARSVVDIDALRARGRAAVERRREGPKQLAPSDEVGHLRDDEEEQ